MTALISKELAPQLFQKKFSGLYIRLERELGIDRKTLSEMSGIHAAIISKMINAQSRNLSWYSAYAVTKVLGITLNDLLEQDTDKTFLKVKIFLGKPKKT